MKKKIFLLLFLLSLFISGFLVEYVKVNINYHIETGGSIAGYFEQTPEVRKQWLDSRDVNAPFDYYYSHAKMDALHYLSLRQLIVLKWLSTVFFVLLFLFLNLSVIKLLIGDSMVIQGTFLAYIVLFMLAFALFAFGKMTGNAEQYYAVSRKIVGALQSPVPLMLIYPAWILYKKTKQS